MVADDIDVASPGVPRGVDHAVAGGNPYACASGVEAQH